MAKKKSNKKSNKKKSNSNNRNNNAARRNTGKQNSNHNTGKQSSNIQAVGKQNTVKPSTKKKNEAELNKVKKISDTKEQELKVKKDKADRQSQLKSVMNSMEKLGEKNASNKKNRTENNRTENNSKETEDIKNTASGSDTLMDFSRIDDEYKGELRRKLTPKERFFRTCEKFGDLFLLNVFFTLTCLPVVTIGASFTALYTVTLKMVRNEDVPIKDGYFKAFKRNFKQSTLLWLIVAAAFAFIGWQLNVVFNSTSAKMNMLVMVVGLELLVMTFLVPLLFPFAARYENTTGKIIKNSLLASLLHLGTWATVFFLWMIPVVIYYLKPHVFFYTWYLWLVFLSSFVAYTCSYRLRSLFDKLEEDPVSKINDDNTGDNINESDSATTV